MFKRLWRGFIGTLGCLIRRPDPWTESMLITEHGTVYTIRDRAGFEREIQHPRTGRWERESRVTFSQLPMCEDYHREQYRAAKPYTLNARLDRSETAGREDCHE